MRTHNACKITQVLSVLEKQEYFGMKYESMTHGRQFGQALYKLQLTIQFGAYRGVNIHTYEASRPTPITSRVIMELWNYANPNLRIGLTMPTTQPLSPNNPSVKLIIFTLPHSLHSSLFFTLHSSSLFTLPQPLPALILPTP